MSDQQRIRRPRLKRTKPYRSWADVLSGPRGPDEGVGREVDSAYQVFEDSMREGAASARAVPRPRERAADPQQWLDAFGRTTGDLFSLYVDWSRAVGLGGLPFTSGVRSSEAPRAHETVEPLRVAVEVDGGQPVRVAIDLQRDARYGRLRLKPVSGQASPVRSIELDPSSTDRVVVRVRTRGRPSSGTYTATIIDDASSQPAGRIAVTVRRATRVSRRSRQRVG